MVSQIRIESLGNHDMPHGNKVLEAASGLCQILTTLVVVLYFACPALGDVIKGDPGCLPTASWSCNGFPQAAISFVSIAQTLCPGGWTHVEVGGGIDCDHAVGGGCVPTCSGVETCTQAWNNEDQRFNWTITGYVDRKILFTEGQVNVRDHAGIEALATYNSGTISVTVQRNECGVCPDSPGGKTVSANISVIPPFPKTRSACHSPGVSGLGWVTASDNWGLEARKDIDMPAWVPNGLGADNHECVDFDLTGPTTDFQCLPTILPGANWWTNVPYHVVIVDAITTSGGSATGLGQKPGNHIAVSNQSPNKMRTLGHEWGHNGGLGHNSVSSNVMRDPNDQGTNIATNQTSKWFNQPANPAP